MGKGQRQMERQYNNPGIREAVFECRFLAGSDWDQTIPGLLYGALKENYPKKETRVLQEMQVTQVKDQFVQNVNAKVLAVFKSEDGSKFIQLGPNLLSVNVLSPYPTWNVFYPMITEVLESLSTIANLEQIERAGLRYINQFSFTTKEIELDDYFEFTLKKSVELPPNFAEFIVGGLFVVPGDRDLCRIQLASAKPEIPSGLSVDLDLDYFTNNNSLLPFALLNEWVVNAHSNVIAFFENCIKDSIREMMGVQ